MKSEENYFVKNWAKIFCFDNYLSATMDPDSNFTGAERTAELVSTTDLEPKTTSSPTSNKSYSTISKPLPGQ